MENTKEINEEDKITEYDYKKAKKHLDDLNRPDIKGERWAPTGDKKYYKIEIEPDEVDKLMEEVVNDIGELIESYGAMPDGKSLIDGDIAFTDKKDGCPYGLANALEIKIPLSKSFYEKIVVGKDYADFKRVCVLLPELSMPESQDIIFLTKLR